jgi:nitroreductase
MMSGIVFLKTADRSRVVEFYTGRIGMGIWLEQADCTLLKHGNLIIGFHAQSDSDLQGLITFVYPDRAAVDRVHAALSDVARSAPRVNERYGIYHFFGVDPEGRGLEFQSFENPVPPSIDGLELLTTRRSIRTYRPEPPPSELIDRILSIAKVAPSARNTQPWEFVMTRDRERLAALAAVRGDSSAPIARAPMAVAITADPEITPLPVDDASIMAYHFSLVAWLYGLGTCWIGRMDRDDVKEILGIPKSRYVATVMPLGWPAETPSMRPRRDIRRREA